MSQHLLSFAKENLADRSDAYLALLWCMYKTYPAKGRYSDHIKAHLTVAADHLLGMDYQRAAARFKKILDAKPELAWVAPSGLSPLAHLQVKNFRGFGEFGTEDSGTVLRFSKVKNIFYAPNGGGKSSLCEALEYATTGHIKEADRRKTKIKQYVGRGSAKVSLSLVGTDKQLVKRSLTWSSCFIDRNRLQEFSLLGSKDTGSAESDVVATLFGLEEFQQVITRFVKPESFNLKSHHRPSSADALSALDVQRASLRDQRKIHSSNIVALNKEVCGYLGLPVGQEDAVRTKYVRLAKLAEMKIRKAERLLLAKPPLVIAMKRFQRAAGIARRLLMRKANIEAALLQNVAGFNYRAIFEAVHALEHADASNACPACSTPLDKVVENPFEKARRVLQTLGELDQLQLVQRQIEARITKMAVGTVTSFAGLVSNMHVGVPCTPAMNDFQAIIDDFYTATDRAAISTQILHRLLQLHSEDFAELEDYMRICETICQEVAQAGVKGALLEQQASALQATAESLKVLFGDKKTSERDFYALGTNLADLALQRATLSGLDTEDTRFNEFIDQLQVEYGNLYRDLLQYKLTLEKTRIAGIEGKAAEYYRAINQHDEDHEQIGAISFEKISDSYRIRILNVDGSSLDAFSVLSEGHLRALGLSLLLAAAEKNKFPLIVFDDVVNAIDSDHRSNIIDLFFSDPYLRRTQMVVTTHDRLFWERFCIVAERHPQADQHGSCVLSYTNRGIVMVDHAGGFQEKVHRAMGVYDIRQALIYCRIWFESMVVEYCLDNAVSITAQFGKSQLKKNNYLQISLEHTFRLVEPLIAYDLQHFNLIKSDLVNWSGQNQEHHAFDEGGLNFVHSKTSKEVIKIYDAIRLLECQLFPAKKQLSCTNLIEDLNEKIRVGIAKTEKLDKAPFEVQQAHRTRLATLQKRTEEAAQELEYVGVCLAATAQ